MLSFEIRVNVMIETTTSTVLEIMLKTMALIGVLCKLRKPLVACRLMATEAMEKENVTFQYFLRVSFL